MTQEQIEKLKGVELNKAVAHEVMGWELLTIRYIDTEHETLRQKELNSWLDKNELHTLGDHWINVDENFHRYADSFLPVQSWRDMEDVVTKLHDDMGLSVQLLFDYPYLPNVRILNRKRIMVANQYDKNIGVALCRAALLAVKSLNE